MSSTQFQVASLNAGFEPSNSAAAARSAILGFMSRSGISIRGIKFDPNGIVEKRTREQAAQWDLGGVSLQRYDPYLISSVHIASAAYSHTPVAVQVHISLYTLLAICIDDFSVPHRALEEFMERLYTGSPQLHPLLDRLVENLLDMKEYFTNFAAKQIMKSTVDFVNNMAVDGEIENMALRPDALSYVTSKRFYNGIGDAYAHFVWVKADFPSVTTFLQAIPETAIFCDFVNDIFSFYKEEIAHETANFIHERAVVTSKDAAAALADVVDETVAAIDKGRRILEGDKEKEAFERFMAGYVAFHRLTPRYRLKDVFGVDPDEE